MWKKFCKAYLKIPIIIRVVGYFIIGLLLICMADNIEELVNICIIYITPLILIFFIRKSVEIQVKSENENYTSRENILYYREQLDNLSPAVISIIDNLEIEEKKDISAGILKLMISEHVIIENESLKTTDKSIENLSESQKVLYEMIKDGKIDTREYSKWREACFNEAITSEYIKHNKENKFLFITLLEFVILFFVFIYMSLGGLSKTFDAYSKYEALGETYEFYDEKGNKYTKFIEGSKGEKEEEFYSTVAIIGAVGLRILPFFTVMYMIIYEIKRSKYIRTEKGEIAKDKINGLRKFIAEYTNLSEKEKKDAVLWDDFLVYAVIFEDNQKIIKEICSLKSFKIDIDKFDLYMES